MLLLLSINCLSSRWKFLFISPKKDKSETTKPLKNKYFQVNTTTFKQIFNFKQQLEAGY